jgi:hypothetical protein
MFARHVRCAKKGRYLRDFRRDTPDGVPLGVTNSEAVKPFWPGTGRSIASRPEGRTQAFPGPWWASGRVLMRQTAALSTAARGGGSQGIALALHPRNGVFVRTVLKACRWIGRDQHAVTAPIRDGAPAVDVMWMGFPCPAISTLLLVSSGPRRAGDRVPIVLSKSLPETLRRLRSVTA